MTEPRHAGQRPAVLAQPVEAALARDPADLAVPRPAGAPEPEREPAADGVHLPVRVVLRGGLVTVVAVVLLVVLVPRVSGTTWSAIGGVLAGLSALQVAGLLALWVLGLYAQSFVLTAALPGLTHRRALLLNLTGSAVSNTVPLGGALGVGINYMMVRHWGFSRAGFAVFTVLTNVWDVSAKLCLPAVAIVVLVLAGEVSDPTLVAVAGTAVAVLVLIVATVAAALHSRRVAGRAARVVERMLNGLLRLARSGRRVAAEQPLLAARERSQTVVRAAWPQLTWGIAAYVAMLFALLWCCLFVLGSTLGPAAVFAGFALERTLTLLVVTPAGAGLAETGAVALFVALGGEPATVAAAVLLYRGLILGMEVPVGASALAGWLALRRRARAPVAGRPAASPR